MLNAEKASSDTAQAHKVKTFYPFSQIRSWENHGTPRRPRLPFFFFLFSFPFSPTPPSPHLLCSLSLSLALSLSLCHARGDTPAGRSGEFLIIEVSRGKKNAAPGAKPLQVRLVWSEMAPGRLSSVPTTSPQMTVAPGPLTTHARAPKHHVQ